MSLRVNEVYFGDCLDLMDSIDEESIDMILCDLPYGKTRNQWDILLSKHTLLFMKRFMILKGDSKMYQEDTIQRMLKDTNELEGN